MTKTLGFNCDLLFGAWNFHDFHRAGKFREIIQWLV